MAKNPDINLLRQRRLSKLIAEDGGKSPIGKLMKRAGYSDEYATNPQKLRKTKSWQQLMEQYIPDDLLARKHKELLNKQEVVVIGKKGERETVMTGVPDANAVGKGLDMAYKLKGKYTPEKHEVMPVIVRHITEHESAK